MAETKVIDSADLPERIGTTYYPEPLRAICDGRRKRALGNAAGMTRFGINLTVLEPGAASALRHWHSKQEEFVYVIEGEVTLITDTGEAPLGPGMAAGFPPGTGDGHHLVNRGDRSATILEIGDRPAGDEAHYPDVDFGPVRVY